MNQLNSVLVEGNLVADPEFSETARGISLCTFAIASERFTKRDEEYEKEVSFFEIVTWGRMADACITSLTKGRGVRVVGRLTQDRWEADGAKHSRVKIVAEHVEFRPLKASTSNVAPVDADDPHGAAS